MLRTPDATEDQLLVRYGRYHELCLALLKEVTIWAAVEAVAAALLKAGKLTFYDVSEAIGGSSAPLIEAAERVPVGRDQATAPVSNVQNLKKLKGFQTCHAAESGQDPAGGRAEPTRSPRMSARRSSAQRERPRLRAPGMLRACRPVGSRSACSAASWLPLEVIKVITMPRSSTATKPVPSPGNTQFEPDQLAPPERARPTHRHFQHSRRCRCRVPVRGRS